MDVKSLILAACSDPSLSQQAKDFLSNTENHHRFAKILSGVTGAALGVAVAKYKKLSRVSQVLLGVAGYGIGTIVYNHLHDDKNNFSNYNNKVNAYEIDRKRY